MSRTALLVLLSWPLVVATSGCLKDPQPLGVTTGLDGATVTDASDVAPAPEEVESDTPSSLAESDLFPPTELPLRVRGAIAADLDGNGLPSLLVQSRPTGTDGRGVFVLGHRADGFLDTYDQFLPTRVHPDAVDVTDVLGSEGLDLLVYGDDGQSRGWLLCFEHLGEPGAPFDPTPLERETTLLTPVGEEGGEAWPVFVTALHVNGDGPLDVVLGYKDDALKVVPTEWTPEAFAKADQYFLDPPPGRQWWELAWLNLAAPIAGADGDTWLLLKTNSDVLLYEQAGGVLAAVPQHHVTGDNSVGHTLADVDGDGILDVLAFGLETLALLTLDPPTVTVATRDLVGDDAFDIPPPKWFDDLLALPLDDDDDVDLVLLDTAPPASGWASTLRVLYDVYDEGGTLASPNSVEITHLPDGARPHVMVAGDFDEDGVTELLLLDEDGQTWCYRHNGGALGTCPWE